MFTYCIPLKNSNIRLTWACEFIRVFYEFRRFGWRLWLIFKYSRHKCTAPAVIVLVFETSTLVFVVETVWLEVYEHLFIYVINGGLLLCRWVWLMYILC